MHSDNNCLNFWWKFAEPPESSRINIAEKKLQRRGYEKRFLYNHRSGK